MREKYVSPRHITIRRSGALRGDTFNPSTTIEYGIPAEGSVLLRVFDLLGREVAVLVDAAKQAGTHTAVFNASEHPSGIYVYQLECNGTVMTRRMTLMK